MGAPPSLKEGRWQAQKEGSFQMEQARCVVKTRGGGQDTKRESNKTKTHNNERGTSGSLCFYENAAIRHTQLPTLQQTQLQTQTKVFVGFAFF